MARGGGEVFRQTFRLLQTGRPSCRQGSFLFRNGSFCGDDIVGALIGPFMARVAPTWVRGN